MNKKIIILVFVFGLITSIIYPMQQTEKCAHHKVHSLIARSSYWLQQNKVPLLIGASVCTVAGIAWWCFKTPSVEQIKNMQRKKIDVGIQSFYKSAPFISSSSFREEHLQDRYGQVIASTKLLSENGKTIGIKTSYWFSIDESREEGTIIFSA